MVVKEALFQGRGTQPSTLTYTETVEDTQAKTTYPTKNRTTLQGLYYCVNIQQCFFTVNSRTCARESCDL